jgi:peptidoglycan/LPS O-acetylase OafA/YrhL
MLPYSQRNFGLDVLRGLAIFLVMTHHLALPFRLPLFDGVAEDYLGRRIVGALSYSGHSAVYLFFVLSGFLIARRCIEQFGSLAAINWRVFYHQRARRIVPLFAVLLIFISVLHFLHVPYFRIENEGQTWLGAIFSAVFLHLNWYEGQTTWLPAAWDVLWSLSIEEVFYIAFPILCLLLPKRILPLVLIALALSLPWMHAALAENEIWQEKAYMPGFSAIACGVLTALAAQHFRLSHRFNQVLAMVGIVAILMCLLWSGVLWSHWQDATLLIFCMIASICIYGASFAWLAPKKIMQILFGWLARLGRLSYELYLTHMLVQIPFVAFVQIYFPDHKSLWCLSYPIGILLCLGLALLVEKYISGKLGNWVFGKRM